MLGDARTSPNQPHAHHGPLQRVMNEFYNMVGMAVTMVISTMHEKSCIDSHNARKFEKKLQNPVIHTSRNHNDEIAEVSQSWISYHNYATQLFRKLFVTKLSQNSYLK